LFFFWRKSGTVVVVGVPDVFFALCKKCDRKKQQQGGCAEAGIKTVQALTLAWISAVGKVEGRGFISGWGKKPLSELPVIEFQVY